MSTDGGVLKPDIPAALGIVNALLAEVAVIDREGTIVLTNDAWCALRTRMRRTDG